MEFRFDGNQEHQLRAIDAIADLFDGQPRLEANLTFNAGEGFAAIANRLDLSEDDLLRNVQLVQQRNGIKTDEGLQVIEQVIQTSDGERTTRFPNFTVEMETGTGKTYAYLRTALELHKRFGMSKFIIVVPSVAVREGVVKALKMTQKHLRGLYDNVPYRFTSYSSDDLAQVGQFALSNGIEVMVMTLDSFNKASNVLRDPNRDHMHGKTPIHLVQATRPILILDEPQNMESETSIAALAHLDPLFALRYSATPRNPYNLVYRLTPFEAYRQGLVKRITVASVVKENEANQAFMRLDDITSKGSALTASIGVHKRLASGSVSEKVVKVKHGDDLAEKSDNPLYNGLVVSEVNVGEGFVLFENGVELRKGQSLGADKEAIFEAQIRYTVEEHMRRQERLRSEGIKVLSLFFIDRVANYTDDEGVIRRLFVMAFNEEKAKHEGWRNVNVADVHRGYFAAKNKKGGEREWLDSIEGGKKKEDEEAYRLIMQDKEALLSFETPLAFIFSHSALREGWDNPNVFTICTLNQTTSEVKKRQEIGRGVRLAVNQKGDRVREPTVNVLTVVANQAYETYVASLQAEIAAEYGAEGVPPPPSNARERKQANLNKQRFLSEDFKALWLKVRTKTRYNVSIDSQAVVKQVITRLAKEHIKAPRIAITKVDLTVADEAFQAREMSGARTLVDLAGRYPLPNLVEVMGNLMEHTTPPIKLTRGTLLQIVQGVPNPKTATDNPHEFATVAVRIIKEVMAGHLVSGLQYERLNDWYEMTQFEDDDGQMLLSCLKAEKSIFDHVPYQSKVERDFIQALEARTDVLLYVKLPGWFTVETPVGHYNPDWAIVKHEAGDHDKSHPKLYLVRETKGEGELRPSEERKIECGTRHFNALGVDYRRITLASQLP